MKTKALLTLACIALLFQEETVHGDKASLEVAPAIELHDQYDQPQKLDFPRDRITVLTLADRKGADEVDAWIAALKGPYSGRIDFRGVASVGGVPGFLQGRIRKKFQESRSYPVMMDWSGKVCQKLNYEERKANVLILDRDGKILGRFAGEATSEAVKHARQIIDQALAGSERKNG